MLGSLRILLLVFLASALSATAAEPAAPGRPAAFDPTDRYVVRQIQGWRVLVHPDLLEHQAELGERALTHLGHQLYQIERRLPAAAVEQLRKVTIWTELHEPHHKCMAYHPDAGWLKSHGMNPQKAKCVEIANADTFLTWTIQQPWMVLHELAHAYHDQFLDAGFDNPDVLAAYNQAMQAKRYDSVLRINGHKDRHYASNNQMEYFAEATEAFWGTNDFYPYVRSELTEHDPQMFKLLGKLWSDATVNEE